MTNDEITLWKEYAETKLFGLLTNFYAKTIKNWKSAAVRKYPALSEEEIETEILYGVYEASKAYKVESGIQFFSFAQLRVWGQIKDYCRSLDGVTRSARKAGIISTSLNAPQLGGEQFDGQLDSAKSWVEAVEDASDALSRIEDVEVWKKIHSALTRSFPQGLLCLNILFREGWSHKELAKYWNVCESRVSQIKSEAMLMLKNAKGVQNYLFNKGYKKFGVKPKNANSKHCRAGINFMIPCTGKTCSTLECHDPAHARGKCMSCYYKQRKQSKLSNDCSVMGCTAPIQHSGLCWQHWKESRPKLGDRKDGRVYAEVYVPGHMQGGKWQDGHVKTRWIKEENVKPLLLESAA